MKYRNKDPRDSTFRSLMEPQYAAFTINQPSGRAVTQPSHLPWSSGDDFRLSLIPISAGDRGSIPRGRDLFFALAGWPNGKALDYESRDCRFDPCVGHFFLLPGFLFAPLLEMRLKWWWLLGGSRVVVWRL
ncbi:hypothetical protein N7471_001514 [Penicillium samsonianum]|uniref:uncharacterized protein n=1 Tax=Penicillium samsonianum TaxID=1882272 RepID=UPI002547F782|nr:uncharacterized protein N7471_001514 [Penicillium samsonianum]KAJ6150315.1 hypothetical protein N7471_001514 [Penicillium samsonianum]